MVFYSIRVKESVLIQNATVSVIKAPNGKIGTPNCVSIELKAQGFVVKLRDGICFLVPLSNVISAEFDEEVVVKKSKE